MAGMPLVVPVALRAGIVLWRRRAHELARARGIWRDRVLGAALFLIATLSFVDPVVRLADRRPVALDLCWLVPTLATAAAQLAAIRRVSV